MKFHHINNGRTKQQTDVIGKNVKIGYKFCWTILPSSGVSSKLVVPFIQCFFLIYEFNACIHFLSITYSNFMRSYCYKRRWNFPSLPKILCVVHYKCMAFVLSKSKIKNTEFRGSFKTESH